MGITDFFIQGLTWLTCRFFLVISADIVVMHNVFEFFMEKELQIKWVLYLQFQSGGIYFVWWFQSFGDNHLPPTPAPVLS